MLNLDHTVESGTSADQAHLHQNCDDLAMGNLCKITWFWWRQYTVFANGPPMILTITL